MIGLPRPANRSKEKDIACTTMEAEIELEVVQR